MFPALRFCAPTLQEVSGQSMKRGRNCNGKPVGSGVELGASSDRRKLGGFGGMGYLHSKFDVEVVNLNR